MNSRIFSFDLDPSSSESEMDRMIENALSGPSIGGGESAACSEFGCFPYWDTGQCATNMAL